MVDLHTCNVAGSSGVVVESPSPPPLPASVSTTTTTTPSSSSSSKCCCCCCCWSSRLPALVARLFGAGSASERSTPRWAVLTGRRSIEFIDFNLNEKSLKHELMILDHDGATTEYIQTDRLDTLALL
ncbi:hypothetical protein T07_14699 [Trichinella nelsoni]|uniref:Uncharacterized protein n=1 Tax=Trichinella nelsoni TaxID=6336 RepID=A0A0V0SCS8_9BILA|nr:hypothetical protein T07_14699 [Trichinella nelsoni]